MLRQVADARQRAEMALAEWVMFYQHKTGRKLTAAG
jgi:hypothetical protein